MQSCSGAWINGSIIQFVSLRETPSATSDPTSPQHPLSPTLTMAFNPNALRGIYRLAVPAAIGASILSQSIYDVRGGSRAVIFDRLSGVKEGVISEGTHLLIPWLQKSIIFDVRTKPRNIATTTGSKDLQMVSLTLRVLHRPDVQALPKIYQVCFFLPPSFFRSHQMMVRKGARANTVKSLVPRPRLRRARPPLDRQRSPQSHRRPIRRRRAHHAARGRLQPHPHRPDEARG